MWEIFLCSLSRFSSWSITVMKKRRKGKQNIFFCCNLRYFPGFHRYEKKGFEQIHNLLFALVDLQALWETHMMDVDFFMAPGTTERSQEDNSGAPSCLFPDPALFLIPSICLFTVPSFQKPYSNTGARNPWNLLSQGFALLQRDWAPWVGGCPLLPGWRKSNQLILTEIN